MNYKIIPAVIGLSFCVICSVITFLYPDQLFSQEENRSLQPVPTINVQTLLSKTALKDTENYLIDHAIGHTAFTKASRNLKLLLSPNQINNIFVLKDKLISKVGSQSPVTAKKSTDAINSYISHVPQTTSVYFALAPTACEVYKDELPHDPSLLDQIDTIRKIYNDTSTLADKENPYGTISGANCIDIYSAMMAQKSEYIYYKTDSCWTSLGAYIAYSNLITSMGEQAVSKDMFNISHVSYDYLGDLYQKTLIAPSQTSDRIDLYSYAPEPIIKRIVKYNANQSLSTFSLYFEEYLDTRTQEKVFLGDPCGITKIQTSIDNHQNLLLFGDQLSAPLLQFLSLHFENITYINLRYVTEEQVSLLESENYQTVLFLYSLDTYLSDNSIATNLPLFTQSN
jgi:hypothetical protein